MVSESFARPVAVTAPSSAPAPLMMSRAETPDLWSGALSASVSGSAPPSTYSLRSTGDTPRVGPFRTFPAESLPMSFQKVETAPFPSATLK